MQAFIYLAHRDKKGIQLMGIMQSKFEYCQKVNPKDLGLTAECEKTLTEIVHKDRMKWDLWIESANNYEELIKRLTNRGFSNFPRFNTPKFNFSVQNIISKFKQD